MAWDIYGNNLREGFCEVHPYVNEDYPCRICCDEIQKEEDRRREHDRQKADYEKAVEHEYYKAMEGQQISQLKADKAELLKALEKTNNAIRECDWTENEGSPHLIPIYEHNQSLIQKYKK